MTVWRKFDDRHVTLNILLFIFYKRFFIPRAVKFTGISGQSLQENTNPYVYDFARMLMNNIWIELEDGMPTIGKITKFMTKNGMIVTNKLMYYPSRLGVEVLHGEVWDVENFNKWQPCENEVQDD